MERFKDVINKRQFDLAIILENVHDPHNIGAVIRSCESVGVLEIFVLYTDPLLQKDELDLTTTTATGASKWVDVHYYTDIDACFKHVKSKYKGIYSTHLDAEAVSLYSLDLCQSIALMFGNERDGLTQAALAQSNGNFIIPQMGMVQSLNISVACAVSLFEALRQREANGQYDQEWTPQKEALLEEYVKRHQKRYFREKVEKTK